jgi:transposase
MLYIGIDHHKRHSTFTCVNQQGEIIKSERLYNSRRAIERFLADITVGNEFEVVLEAGRNWGIMYDTLEEIPKIKKVFLCNPYKTRAIADARIKTDTIDSLTLAELLRANLIPSLWIPPKDIREIKNVARYRIYLVRQRVKIKNRIHNIIERTHLEKPEVSDLFGRYGREWLNSVQMPEKERKLLDYHLEMYDYFTEKIKEIERWINEIMRGDEDIELLMSIPGIGKVFAVIIKLEIGDINRFAHQSKLHSYSGIVPSTYQSGSRIYHGRLIKRSNKYLRWAFIEAAVSSIRSSVYFRAHYERIKSRKGSQAAIVSTARKLATVVYKILTQRRAYSEII